MSSLECLLVCLLSSLGVFPCMSASLFWYPSVPYLEVFLPFFNLPLVLEHQSSLPMSLFFIAVDVPLLDLPCRATIESKKGVDVLQMNSRAASISRVEFFVEVNVTI